VHQIPKAPTLPAKEGVAARAQGTVAISLAGQGRLMAVAPSGVNRE
jgi:hypothetical protein